MAKSFKPHTKAALAVVVIMVILIGGLVLYDRHIGLNKFSGRDNLGGQRHGTKTLPGCDITQCPYDRPKCCEVYDKPEIGDTNPLDLLEPMADGASQDFTEMSVGLDGAAPTDSMLATKARWTDPTVARTTGIIHSMKAAETSLGINTQPELSMDQAMFVNKRVSPFAAGITGQTAERFDRYNPETIQERKTDVVRRPYDWTARTDAEDLPETVLAGLNSIQMPSTATVREMSRLDSGPDEFAGQVLSAPGSFDAVHAGALKRNRIYSHDSAYPFEHQMNFEGATGSNHPDRPKYSSLTSVSYGRIAHPYGDENYSPGLAIDRNAPLMHQPDVNNTPVSGPGVGTSITNHGVDMLKSNAAEGPLRPRTKVDNYSNALVDPSDGRAFMSRLYNAI